MEKFKIIDGNVICHYNCKECFIMKYANGIIGDDDKIIYYYSVLDIAVKQLIKEGKISVDMENAETDCAIVYRYMLKLEMEKKIKLWKKL
jgi:hypothetical protein